MDKKLRTLLIAALICFPLIPAAASAATTATAHLSFYIQNGTITNNSTSTANITSIIYDLGTPGDGIASWDNGLAGGVASNFLSDPQFFQTVTWSGLNVAAGSNFSFSGLDIDLIQTLSPLNVVGSPVDSIGTSLANATLKILWDNGDIGSVPLVQQAWQTDQHLNITGSPVPVPAAIWLLGSGLVGLLGMARKKSKSSVVSS